MMNICKQSDKICTREEFFYMHSLEYFSTLFLAVDERYVCSFAGGSFSNTLDFLLFLVRDSGHILDLANGIRNFFVAKHCLVSKNRQKFAKMCVWARPVSVSIHM